MKQIIKLTESDLYRIVKESINKIIRESKYDYYDSSPYDEYNEFDRNMNDEIESDCYKAKYKLTKGDYSKNTINTLLKGIKEGDEEAIDAYYIAKRDVVCPTFVKQAENIMSWSEIYDTYNPIRGDSLGTDFDGRTRLGSSFSNAALNGVNYVRGNNEPNFEKIYGGSPKNDINLNIYNRNGKLGMAALYPDTEKGNLARLARPTIRATYNAAKDYQKSRNESD
jgi:hypothetical protein